MSVWRFVRISAGLAIGIAALACTEEETKAEGVVVGRMQMVGGPAGVGSHPAPGTVTFRSAEAGDVTASTSADGEFRLTLSPGTYVATGTSRRFNQGRQACVADGPVQVSDDETVTVNVNCHRR